MINSSTQLDESNLSSPKVNSINKNQQRFVKQLSLYSQSPSQTPKFHNFKEENNKRNSPKCENNSQRIPIYHKNENHIVDIYSFCQLQKQQLQEQYQKNKTLDSLASSFHTLFTTEDVIQLLEQPLDQRRIKGLRQMRIYFQEYQFFQNLLAQEGQEFVNQCTDNLTCKSFKKNTLMFNSSLGEIEPDVRGVMILIKGKCRVFYDRECSLKYILNQKCDFEENSKLVSEGFTLGAYEYEQDSETKKNILTKVLKFRQEKRELIEFFRSISIFQNFEDMTLVEVILQCEKQNFNRMQYVYKDGDDSNYIYFVFEGEFRLNKQRRANSSQELESDQRQINDPHHNKKLLAMIPKQFIQKNQQNQDKLPASSIQQSADDKNTFHNKKLKDLYSQMLQKKKKKWSQKQDQITLIIYERGTFFGEKEIIDDLQNQESISFHKNKKKREFSIQCMSDQGICYRFSYFKFLKLINNHRQIFTHLSELNDQLNEWINHRIEQVLNPQILTSQVQEVSQSQQLKQIKWKQEQDEVKAKLLEQHKAATKYLQQTLNQLQVRIKREDKERNLKVSNIARELTKLRESRHQFLHLNLIERKKKEHLVISKLEQQSQSKIKGSPRNQDCQLELNQLSNTIKRPSLHNENSQSSTFVRSKVDIQLTQNEENYLTPQYLTQKSISAESQKQQTSKIDLLANKSSHVLPKNYKETTKQIKCSQSTKNLNTVSLSPIRNIKQTSKNQEIQVKQRNSSNNQDRQLSSEYSSGNQGQESIKKKRVISFLKREQQTNYLPQFFIKSSIPLQEYQLKNSQINNLSSSMSTDQNQSTLILRENQILNQSDNLRKSSKSKVTHLNINETETSNKNLITKASYPKLYTQSGNGFIPNKCISSSSKKQHQSIMRYITQPHQIDDSFEMIPLKTCISYNTQPYENLQNLASANQNINCNKYQINILDSNSFIVKSRSITNSDQKFINFQSLTNDSSSFKSKDLDTKMESYFKMKDTSPTKIQKLPLKYFVNQYKIVQKHHLGMKNYNLKKQPTDQSSLKIVSPRLQPSPI